MDSINFRERAAPGKGFSKPMAYILALTLICLSGFSVRGVAEQDKAQTPATPLPKVSMEQAMRIASKRVPGEVTDATVETKKGKKVYVIEIIANKGGKETDVFVDMQTGEILGVD